MNLKINTLKTLGGQEPNEGILHRPDSVIPGVAVCLSAAGVAIVANVAVPALSPLLVAVVLGVTAVNLRPLPSRFAPGLAFSAKKLLRWGIVFLGLKLALEEIWGLGVPTLLVVLTVVAGGIGGTILLGKALAVPRKLTLLIGCGFSICGAAAVAGVEGVLGADEEDVITAVGLVVLFGTLMIPLLPVAGFLLGLDAVTNGLWDGASVHEVAQVVAAGELIGGGALQVAVVTKLARVLLLAPVVLVLAVTERKKSPAETKVRSNGTHPARTPPIVPLFIVGFLVMVVVRSIFYLPQWLLTGGGITQVVLLSAAMFALGSGVKFGELRRVGLSSAMFL